MNITPWGVLARIVHNIGTNPITLRYEDAKRFAASLLIRIDDITESSEPRNIPFTISGTTVLWTAEPRHTYYVVFDHR